MALTLAEYNAQLAEEKRQRQSEEAAKAALIVTKTSSVNPDAYAQDMQLGKAFGAPMLADALHRGPAIAPLPADLPAAEDVKMEMTSRLARLKAETTLSRAPVLSGWLGIEQNAKLAHDDLDGLALVEQSLRNVNPQKPAPAQSLAPSPSIKAYEQQLPLWLQYPKEAGKGIAAGALGVAQSTVEGIGTMSAPGAEEQMVAGALDMFGSQFRTETPEIASRILDAKKLSPEELAALRAEIAGQGEINPSFAQSILSGVLEDTTDEMRQEHAEALDPAFKGLANRFDQAANALREVGKERLTRLTPEQIVRQALGQKIEKPGFTGNQAQLVAKGLADFIAENLSATPGYEESYVRSISEGVGSVIAFMVSAAGGSMSAAIVSAQTGAGEAVSRAQKAEQPLEKQQEVALGGALSGLTELVPLDRYLNVPALKEGWKTLAKEAVTSGIYEGGQEVVQQVMQDMFAAAAYDATGSSLKEMWKAFETGGLVGAIVTSAQILLRRHGPGYFGGNMPTKEDIAATKEFYDGLTKAVTTTKLSQRLPAAMRQFVEAVTQDGPVDTMYVPGKDFVAYFQQYGLDKVAAEIPGVTVADIVLAAETGGDVAIPIASWAGSLAATPHNEFILQNARIDPDGYTIREATEINARMSEIMQQAREARDTAIREGQAALSSGEQLAETMTERLTAVGYAPDAARRSARIVSDGIVAMASRLGVTPEEVVERFGLPSVRGGANIAPEAVPDDAFKRTIERVAARRADRARAAEPAPLAGQLEVVNTEAPAEVAEAVAAPAEVPDGLLGDERNEAILDEIDRILEAAGADPAVDDVETIRQKVAAFEASEEGQRYAQSAAGVIDRPYQTKATGAGGKRVSVEDTARAFTEAHQADLGRQLFPETSAEDMETVVAMGSAEVAEQLLQPNSGVGWYSTDVTLALNLASRVFPTLLTDQEHRQVFLTFAGLFSSGTDPIQAFMMASEAFEGFLVNGRIPIKRSEVAVLVGRPPTMTSFVDKKTGQQVTKEAGWGVRSQGNEQLLGFVQYMIDREGSITKAMDWLLTPQTRADISAAMTGSGLWKDGRYKTKAELAGKDEYGFLAFGEKLGRYSMGLHGVEIDAGDTTVDLWYTRTFRRWTGRLFEAPIGDQGIAAQPANDAERNAVFAITGRLAERFGITPGDVQAVLWFFEKRLYGAHGVPVNEGTNSDGAYKLLSSRGISLSDEEKAREYDRARGVGASAAAGSPDGRGAAADGAGGYQSGGLAPLEGAPVVAGASGPDPRLIRVAEGYARSRGIDLRRQAEFVEVDPERAARIAAAYEAMPHAPNDPEVAAAYDDLIEQTIAQYRALEEAGYQFFFFGNDNDPYDGNPWNAMRDLRANQRMAVYATEAGFGVGAQINIGLDDPDGGPPLDPQRVLNAIVAVGGEIEATAQHQSSSEPTLAIKLKHALTQEQGDRLSEMLNQEAIAQRTDDERGDLFGPMASKWGPYNPDFFVTYEGRRASEVANPLLRDTGIRWGYGSPDGEQRPVLANDLFRAVHDAFGHGIEGAGFRARGEENAWQAHIRLFTGKAVGALTSETRGQNSWLNYGPHGEANRTASVFETVFAEQKTGLMPSWTWEEGRAGDMPATPAGRTYDQTETMTGRFYQLIQQMEEIEAEAISSAPDPWGFSNPDDGLIVTHNMGSSMLKTVLSGTGKLPMPSIAVSRASEPLVEFGDVLLIGTRDLVDASQDERNKVYGGDIWSATYPPIDKVGTVDVFNEARNRWVEEQLNAGLTVPRSLGAPYEYQAEDMVAASKYRSMMSDDLAFMYLFMKSNGMTPDVQIVEVSDAPAPKDPGEYPEAAIGDKMLQDGFLKRQFDQAVRVQNWVDGRQFGTVVREGSGLIGDTLRGHFRDSAAELIYQEGLDAPEGASVARMEQAAELLYPSVSWEGVISEDVSRADLFRMLKDMKPNRNVVEEMFNTLTREIGPGVNVQRTKANFRQAIQLQRPDLMDTLRDMTIGWINSANQEMVTYYNEEGDKVRAPATPENIVEAMKSNTGPTGNQRNAVGSGEMVNLRAAVTPLFDDIEQIKRWRDKISKMAFKDAEAESRVRFADLSREMAGLGSIRFGINAMSGYATYDGGDLTMDRFISSMWPTDEGEIRRMVAEEAGFAEKLEAAKANVDDFLYWLVAMPTEYLEAKPERVVDLSEFKAAVVLGGADPEVVRMLQERGIQTVVTNSWGVRETVRAVAEQGNLLFQSAPRGPKGQIQFPAGGVGSGETIIRIFEGADLSTFLHEAGHWHLATLRALAEDPTTPAGSGIKEDWETLKAWWKDNAKAVAKDAGNGVTEEDVIRAIETGTSGDAAKDIAIDVGMHEQFARGFEAYLMEGKAPSQELSGAFASFRSWLIAIYNSIKNLGVQLTPEVKAVMDRMLATKEQIDAAQKAAGGDMLFKSAAEMGVDEASYQALAQLHEQARTEAQSRLLKKFMRPILERKKAEWKAERAEVRASVEKEINARPVYRVIEWLGNRRWLGDTQPEDLPFLTMNEQQLVEAFGVDVLTQLPRGFHRLFSKNPETSMHPDEVAGWFGYETGDEMIRELIEARPRRELIEATTDEIMMDRHGDPMKDGSAEREAQEAYHADTRARFLQAEMDALFKRMGPKGTQTPLSVSREIARRAIAMMPVRRAMVTGAFLKAERQAGFDAQKALAGGDIEAAARAKRMQLLNNLMWVEARKAAAEVERIERLAKRLAKKSVRESLAGSYLEAIDQLLEQYDFRRTSATSDQRRDALARYIAEMTAAGRANELSIPDDLVAETKRIPYKTLTVEQLRGVGDALRNIEHMARLKQKLLDAKAAREMDEVVDDIEQAFTDNVKAKPPSRGQPTAGERWRTGFQRYLNLWLSADTILNEIDGFVSGKLGKVYQHIKGRIDAAQAELVNRRHKAAQDIENLFSVYSRTERQQMGVARQHDQLGGAFSKWELISMALNMGNEGGMERLTNKKTADYLSPAKIEYVKSQLDARDWQFVQSTWDYINSYWPEIEARERRVTGVAPKKVPPLPVETPFGMLRGGYYPIVYDNRLNSRSDALEVVEVANQMKGGAFGKAQTANGFTKERSAETRMRLRYDVGVISKHVNGVLHDLALSEPVTAASRILSDQRVRDLFNRFGRADDLNTLDVWLLDVASGDIVQGDMLNGAARRIKGTFTVGKLLFSVPTAILQATGVFQSAVVVGKTNFVRGLGTYLKNPAIYRDIVQRSDFMRERMTTFNKDLVDLRNDLTKSGPLAGRYSRFMSEVFVPAGFWAMIRAQFHLVDVPTWIAAYQSGTREGMSEADAASYADRMVARSATSGLQTDRSAIERGSISKNVRQQDVIRLFTALGSYMFAKMNVAYGRVRGTDYTSPMQVANLATDLVLLFAVEGLLASIVRNGFPDDDDEDGAVLDEWSWTIARETGLSVSGGLPGIRDMVSVMQGFSGGGAYGGFMDVVGKTGIEAAELGGEIAEGDIDFTRSDTKNWINTLALFVTLPTSQINRSIVDPIFSMMEGEDVSPVEVLMGRQSKQ